MVIIIQSGFQSGQESLIYWILKIGEIADKNRFFHKGLRNGRQVLKSSQNPFLKIFFNKNTLLSRSK